MVNKLYLSKILANFLEKENVELCRQRLLCGCTDEEVIKLVKRRIIVGDCLNPDKQIEGQTTEDHLLMKKYFSKPDLFVNVKIIKAFGVERTLVEHLIFMMSSNSPAFVKKHREDMTKILQEAVIALAK